MSKPSPVVAAVPAVPRPVPAPARPVAVKANGGEQLRRLASRVTGEWLPRVTWSLGRTGRTGLVGAGLLAASLIFFASTQSSVTDEIASLRTDLNSAHAHAADPGRVVSHDPGTALRSLPKRIEMPALLGVLLQQADAAHLTIDSGKYESSTSKAGDVVSYKVSFPVSGPYPQVRQFIDGVLTALPNVAISDLSIERKSIGDNAVEAQIRLTAFTRGEP